jgi:hypothetical protein
MGCYNTYETYKTMIKVITTCFKDYKVEMQKMFQKIEHICRSV